MTLRQATATLSHYGSLDLPISLFATFRLNLNYSKTIYREEGLIQQGGKGYGFLKYQANKFERATVRREWPKAEDVSAVTLFRLPNTEYCSNSALISTF